MLKRISWEKIVENRNIKNATCSCISAGGIKRNQHDFTFRMEQQ